MHPYITDQVVNLDYVVNSGTPNCEGNDLCAF